MRPRSQSLLHERQQARDLDEAFELESSEDIEGYHAHELDTFLNRPTSPHSDDDDRSEAEQSFLPDAHHRDASVTSLFSLESIPMIPLSLSQARAPDLQKKVSLINGLGLVIGSMIGSGLFSSPGPVLEAVGAPGTSLVVWLASGLIAMMGALCYAELGSMLPMNGGETVYLNRAFGSLISFVFEFVTIVVQKPGSLAIVCVIFGEYVSRIIFHTYFFSTPHDTDAAVQLADSVIPAYLPKLIAIICVFLVSAINALSVKAGIRAQDILTILKLLAAAVIAIVGLVILGRDGSRGSHSFDGDLFSGYDQVSFGQYTLALYSGLWAYDGWNNLNYVSGEMKNPNRDLPRVIFIGIPTVILFYILANVAYLAVLPSNVIVHTNTVAMDFGKKLFGSVGGILFALCVALSCFGTANATVFTSSRIVFVSAKQGHIPAFFGKVSPARQTPQTAILLLAVLSIIMIVPGSFKTLVNFYSVCAWLFYFLAVLALIVLRFKEPELKRPYKTWLSTPILFCAIAIFLFVMPFVEAPWESFAALGFTALGVPVWLLRVKYGDSVQRFMEAMATRLGCKNWCSCIPWNRLFFWRRGGEGYERQHMMTEIDDI